MAILGNQQGQLLQVPIFNYEKTSETGKSINVRCDFALDAFYSGNLSQERQQGIFQSIRSIYFNCENCANDVTFSCIDTGQILVFKAGTFGYLPVLVSQGMRFRFDGVAPDVGFFNLLNVDMPPAIWPITGSGPTPPYPFTDIEMTGPALLGRVPAALGPSQEIALSAPFSIAGGSLSAQAAARYNIVGRRTAGAGAYEDSTRQQLNVAGTDLSNVFAQLQTINLNAVSLPAPTAGFGPTLHAGQADGLVHTWFMDCFGSLNVWRARRTNGTAAAPTAVTTNDNIFNISPQGWTSAGAYNTCAGLQTQVTEPWTATANGSRLVLNAANNGQTVTGKWFVQGSIYSSASANLGDGCINVTGVIKTAPLTVAALAAAFPAATVGAGARAFVNDALGPAFGAAVVGGGAVNVPVYSDGVAWNVG